MLTELELHVEAQVQDVMESVSQEPAFEQIALRECYQNHVLESLRIPLKRTEILGQLALDVVGRDLKGQHFLKGKKHGFLWAEHF